MKINNRIKKVLIGLFISISIFSFTFNIYIGNKYFNETFIINPSDSVTIENNESSSLLVYSLNIENNFEWSDISPKYFSTGIYFFVMDLNNDIYNTKFIPYNKRVYPITIDIPQNTRLVITCSEDMTGEAKITIKNKEYFATKSFVVLDNFADTSTIYINSGKSCIYTNDTPNPLQFKLQVSNQLKYDGTGICDFVSVYVKSPYDTEKVKRLNNTTNIKSDTIQILYKILPPGYSLMINSNSVNIKGYCWYKCLSVYN